MFLVVGLTLVGLMMGLMLVASFASSARRFFQSARAQKGTNRTAGSLMVAAGAFLVAKGCLRFRLCPARSRSLARARNKGIYFDNNSRPTLNILNLRKYHNYEQNISYSP